MSRLSEVDPIAFEEVVTNYLDKQEVYDLFSDLVTDLALRRPEDPVDFLIKKLKSSQKMRVFVFGAQTEKSTSICQAAADTTGLIHIRVADISSGLDAKLPSYDREVSGKSKLLSFPLQTSSIR